jgi:nucleotide-binding universal stress UspA family protein
VEEVVSFTVFLSSLMAIFACIGVVLAVAMGRLGHSAFSWGLLGLVLGPIALILALITVKNGRPWSRLVAGGVAGKGPVDVLVGIDGSPESRAATTTVLELIGNRVGRLTLVAVTAIDTSVSGRHEQARLQHELDWQAQRVQAWLQARLADQLQAGEADKLVTPKLMLRSGQPAVELERIAAEDGYGLLVVGARGAGLSRALLGSVATRLAAGAKVPVLVVSDHAAQSRTGARHAVSTFLPGAHAPR